MPLQKDAAMRAMNHAKNERRKKEKDDKKKKKEQRRQ